MPLNYLNLDARTRGFMVEEIDMSVKDGSIYLSNFLTAAGKHDWPGLLSTAAATGSDATLANELSRTNG